MSRRDSLHDIQYSNVPKQLRTWESDFSQQLLNVIWQAYDNYYTSFLYQLFVVDITELERSITQELYFEIRIVLRTVEGFGSYELIHGPWELSSLKGTTGRPKQPDLAFVFLEDRRISWPLDAKILNTDGDVAEYIKEVNENFLSCIYAPYSSEGGMIGYLLSGNVGTIFTSLSSKSGYQLTQLTRFPDRNHRTSTHHRTNPNCLQPHQFCCHHLLFKLA